VIQAMIVLLCFAVACLAACLLLGVRMRPGGESPDGVRQPRPTPRRDLPQPAAAPAEAAPRQIVVPLQRPAAEPVEPAADGADADLPAGELPAADLPAAAPAVGSGPIPAPRRPGVNNSRWARPARTGSRTAPRAR
jgi:hypothetical protein